MSTKYITDVTGRIKRLYDLGQISLETAEKLLAEQDSIGPPVLAGDSPSERSLVVDRLLVKTAEGKKRIAERDAALAEVNKPRVEEQPSRVIELDPSEKL